MSNLVGNPEITRLFVIFNAMLVTTGMAVVILGTVINLFFAISALCVVVAIYLYHR